MKLSVVIVNYNVQSYVEQCLRSVFVALKDIDAEVFVVDNHSKDGSVEYLKEKFPDIILIDSNHNLGFSRANNIAIRQSRGEYVLLLNPDTIVAENTIRECVTFMDRTTEAGGLGVRMLTTFGTSAMESRRGIPTPMTALYKVVGLCNRYPKNKRFGKYYMGYLPWDEPARIDVVSGAFFMLRKKAIDQVGLLDEDFFMYGEDIDLSYRILKGGWQNWYLPSRILHYKGESTQKTSFRYVHVFYDAMLIFFRKHFGNLSLLVSLPVKMAICLKATIALLKMQTERLSKALGFSDRRFGHESAFFFVGSTTMLDACRQIVNNNGINAVDFVEGNSETKPLGHQSFYDQLPKDVRTYVVYDIGAYSYDNIFSLFSKRSDPHVFIGTYDVNTGVLITPHEIYKNN